MNLYHCASIKSGHNPRSRLAAGIASFIPIQVILLAVSLNLVWAMPTYAGRKSLAAPSNLAATAVSSSEIDLTWQDNSSNESGFVVQRAATSAGPWSQIAKVGAGVTAYSNTGLSAATIYYYRVSAYNNSSSSSYAGPVSATTWAAACTDTITTGVTPSGAGTASGGGTVTCNSTVTVSASPATGYNFANWTENGTVVSSSPSYTFTASANRNLIANFAASVGNITNNLVGYWRLIRRMFPARRRWTAAETEIMER